MLISDRTYLQKQNGCGQTFGKRQFTATNNEALDSEMIQHILC